MFVLDASVVGCRCFPDEAGAVADATLERLTSVAAVVPALWWFEVRTLPSATGGSIRLEPPTSSAISQSCRSPPIGTRRARAC